MKPMYIIRIIRLESLPRARRGGPPGSFCSLMPRQHGLADACLIQKLTDAGELIASHSNEKDR